MNILTYLYVQGLVVYSNPPSGCPDMQPPPQNTNYTGKWIALIRRYEVRSAQRNGYDAAIVHNVNSSDLGMYI
jgi:hypothetical protein